MTKLSFKNTNILEIAILIWAFTIPFSFSIIGTYVLFTASVFHLVMKRSEIRVKRFKEAYVFYIVIIYLIVSLLGLLYTENIHFGILKVEKRIPLFIVAILGIVEVRKHPININGFVKPYLWGVILALTLIVFYTWFQFYHGNYKAFINVYGVAYINYFKVIKHYTYLGVDLLMALPLLYLYNFSNTKTNYVFYTFSIFIGLMIFLSGAKIILITYFLLLGYIFLFDFLLKKKTVFKYGILIGFVVISVLVINNNPRVNNFKENFAQKESPAWSTPRIQSWKSSINIIKKHRLLGVGIGDYKDELQKQYREHDNLYNARNELNPHNQFLQTTLETGLIGLFLLLMIFLFVLRNNKIDILSGSFAIVFLTCFLVESLLIRMSGAVSFSFWILILGQQSNKQNILSTSKKDSYFHKYFFKTLLGLLILFAFYLLSTFFVKYDFTDPKTYFAVNNKGVRYSECFVDSIFADRIDCVEFMDNSEFSKDSYSDFIAIPFYKTKVQKKKLVNFSLWCFVSKTSNLDQLFIYIYNPVQISERVYYDLQQKGVWQKLEFENVEVNCAYELGLRCEKIMEYSFNGGVKIANPNFEYFK